MDGWKTSHSPAEVCELKPGQSTFIAPDQKHRLANCGPGTPKIIEIQCRNGRGADDAGRLEDNHRGRRGGHCLTRLTTSSSVRPNENWMDLSGGAAR
ncbi:hypothetical protein [Pelagibius sp.]|uniref:hypothetical protein n=1 Tax=Pelagibius sp. TaxID=1931238 RepID=UPI003BB1C41F